MPLSEKSNASDFENTRIAIKWIEAVVYVFGFGASLSLLGIFVLCYRQQQSNPDTNSQSCRDSVLQKVLQFTFLTGLLLHHLIAIVFFVNCPSGENKVDLAVAIAGCCLALAVTLLLTFGRLVAVLHDYNKTRKTCLILTGVAVCVFCVSSWAEEVRYTTSNFGQSGSTESCTRKSVLHVKSHVSAVPIQFCLLSLGSLISLWEKEESPALQNATAQQTCTGETHRCRCVGYSILLLCIVLGFFGSYAGVDVMAIKEARAMNQTSKSSTSSLMQFAQAHMIVHLLAMGFGVIVCFLSTIRYTGLKRKEKTTEFDLDDFLVILSGLAIVCHCVFYIAADIACIHNSNDDFAKYCGEPSTILELECSQLVMNIIQASLQSGLLVSLRRMDLSLLSCKQFIELRLVLFFLMGMNAIWLFNNLIFDIAEIRLSGVFVAEMFAYQNGKTWLILANLYYPLVTYFRLHSLLMSWYLLPDSSKHKTVESWAREWMTSLLQRLQNRLC